VSQVTEAGQSTVDGAGIEIASTAEPASFVIQARDKLGNKCNRGGDPFKVQIKTPQGSEPVNAKVHDNKDGTYTVTYQPKVGGVHEVDISLEGKVLYSISLSSIAFFVFINTCWLACWKGNIPSSSRAK